MLFSRQSIEEYRVPGETQSCPACGSTVLEDLDFAPASTPAKRQGYRLYLVSGCASCGFVFVNPPPSAETQKKIYSADGKWNQSKLDMERISKPTTIKPEDFETIADPKKSILHALMFHYRQDLAESPEEKNILDFGCGEGELLDKLACLGFRTHGIDPATAHLITRHTMLEEIPAEPMFDVVVAKHVFEHLLNPLEVMRALRRSIRDGGLLAVGSPTLDGLTDYPSRKYLISYSHHVCGFTAQSLQSLLGMAGFRVLAVYPGKRPSRLVCIAIAGSEAAPEGEPLRDARDLFQRYRKANAPKVPRRANLRQAAFLENVRLRHARTAGPPQGRGNLLARLIPGRQDRHRQP